MAAESTILSVKDLKISFGDFIAVNDISFDIRKGETLAVVGESGSGKSLTALAIMGLLPANAVVKGQMTFLHGQNSTASFQQLRGKEIAMVFQEPMSSLNPVMKIGAQVTEAIALHQPVSKKQAKQIAI